MHYCTRNTNDLTQIALLRFTLDGRQFARFCDATKFGRRSLFCRTALSLFLPPNSTGFAHSHTRLFVCAAAAAAASSLLRMCVCMCLFYTFYIEDTFVYLYVFVFACVCVRLGAHNWRRRVANCVNRALWHVCRVSD